LFQLSFGGHKKVQIYVQMSKKRPEKEVKNFHKILTQAKLKMIPHKF